MTRPIKLVEYQQQEVSLDAKSLEILPNLLQTRASTNVEVARTYAGLMQKGNIFPPVLVFQTPDGRFLLADGFHRVHAARSLFQRSIKAVVRKGTMEDAILAGIQANLEVHLNKPTQDDRHHAVKIMIRNEKFRQWCDQEIARRCDTSKEVVKRVRLALSVDEKIAIPAKVLVFSKKSPKGQLRVYARKTFSAPLALRKRADGGHTVNFEGHEIHLGKDEAIAKEKLRILGESKENFDAVLASPDKFRAFLTASKIRHQPCDNRMGATKIAGAVLCLVSHPSKECLSLAFCLGMISYNEPDAQDRVVLVGDFKNFPQDATKFMASLSRLDPGIEFLTLSELHAEFAPDSQTRTA